MKKKVWAKIPRAGLANKILVWANALVFATDNKASLYVTNWVSVFIGPILRGENSLRFYFGYFNNQSLFKRARIKLFARSAKLVKNLESANFPEEVDLVVFDKYMDWIVFFDRIRNHSQLVKDKFFNQLLKREYLEAYKSFDSPQIGVHIRMGDFSKPSSDTNNFNHKETVSQQTPINYFVEVINSIRELSGKNLAVTIFSDGDKEQLEPVLSLDNVTMSDKKKDIEDLLWLSKSDLIVTSATSTFSLFAGYLSDAIIIHHPSFFIRPIREESINEKIFEGPFEPNNKLKEHLLRKFN